MAYFKVSCPGPHQRSFPGLLTAWLWKLGVSVQGDTHWEMQNAQSSLWWPHSNLAIPPIQHTLPSLYGFGACSFRRDVPQCLPSPWDTAPFCKNSMRTSCGPRNLPRAIQTEPVVISPTTLWLTACLQHNPYLPPHSSVCPCRHLGWCQSLTGLSGKQFL